MNWSVVLWSGLVAVTLSSVFFWLAHSLGWTSFNPAVQIGCIVMREPTRPITETIGVLVIFTLGVTAVPALYSVLFEALGRTSLLTGTLLGFIHGVLSASALPLLGMISACVRTGRIPAPGYFGIRWGWPAPVTIVVGHLLYGAIVGIAMSAFANQVAEEVL